MIKKRHSVKKEGEEGIYETASIQVNAKLYKFISEKKNGGKQEEKQKLKQNRIKYKLFTGQKRGVILKEVEKQNINDRRESFMKCV